MKAVLLQPVVVTIPAGTEVEVWPYYHDDGTWRLKMDDPQIAREDFELVVYTVAGVTLEVGKVYDLLIQQRTRKVNFRGQTLDSVTQWYGKRVSMSFRPAGARYGKRLSVDDHAVISITEVTP